MATYRADSKFWEQSEIRAKLSYLRADAARALDEYLGLRNVKAPPTSVDYSASAFVTAQAKYTLACAEAQDGSILDYVEVPPI